MSVEQTGEVSKLGLLPVEDIDPAATLMQMWVDDAETTLTPDYYSFPSLDTYLTENHSKLASKLGGPKALGRRANRQLDSATAEYLDYIHGLITRNNKKHDQWSSRAARVCLEAAGISLLAGEEAAAEAFLANPAIPEGEVGRSRVIGNALLATGDHERAKRIITRGSGEPTVGQLYTLLDAYLITGDSGYREPLLLGAQKRPMLLGRVLAHDLDAGNPTDTLYEYASDNTLARIALAGIMFSRRPDTTEGKQAREYLQGQLDQMRPPRKKTIGPADRIGAAFKRDGMFALFDVLDEGLGAAAGDARYEEAPGYASWKSRTSKTLGVVGPFFEGLPGYSAVADEIKSEISWEAYVTEGRLARAEWGDKAASAGILKVAAGDNGLAYRHILRDFGPDAAMKYLPLMKPEERRMAAFNTMVVFAVRGAAVKAPSELPALTDTYGPLSKMYAAAEGVASDQSQDGVDYAAADLAGAEAMVGQIQGAVIDKAGLQEALARIRAVNNPAEEKRLLEQLIAANALPQ